MKIIINILAIIFIYTNFSFSFDWNFNIPPKNYINGTPCFPSPVTVNGTNFTLSIQINDDQPSSFYLLMVDVDQNGIVELPSQFFNISPNPISFNISCLVNGNMAVCLNSPARLIVKVIKFNPWYEELEKDAYIIFYGSSPNCSSLLSLTNGSQSTLQTGVTKTFLSRCQVATSAYSCNVYKLSWNITFPSNKKPVLYKPYCSGISAASQNDLNLWAGIENQTSTSATLFTFSMYATQIGSGNWYWFPTDPGRTAITYYLVDNCDVPVSLGGFSPNPPVIYGEYGSINVYLTQGTCNPNNSFTWSFENKPGSVQFLNGTSSGTNWVTSTPNLSVYWPNSIKNDKDLLLPEWKVWCRGYNNYGWSNQVGPAYPGKRTPVGCPWLFVMDGDSIYQMENNLLNKSKFPENIGYDITDLYVLNQPPGLFNSINTFSISETQEDTSYFNTIKVYAVDHPVGTKLCITEDNQIAVFDSASVLSVKEAYLNQDEITDDIQFHFQPRNTAFGDTTDHVYTYFDNNSFSNLGIIAELKWNPNAVSQQKYCDGFLSANLGNETFDSYLSRREFKSITAIPVIAGNDSPSISTIDIDWYKGNEIGYIALASLNYSNFTVTELPLYDAYNSNQESELYKILETDSYYSAVTPSTSLNLLFWNDLVYLDESIRDYVIEVNGRIGSYYSGSKDYKTNNIKVLKQKNNSVAFKNKLNQNYPNPFNPLTKISYSVAKQGLVTIKIYDILGREIKSLVNEIKGPGNYLIEFNGSNLTSGIYFYRFEANGFVEVKKMVLIK
jgi:hypothetical protein